MSGKARLLYDSKKFLRIMVNVFPHHGGCVLEHIGKKAAAPKGLVARLYHQTVAHRDGQLPPGGNMGTEGRIIRGFVVAEPGVPHQFEGQILRRIVQDASIRLTDFENQVLYQRFKLSVGLLVFGLVCVYQSRLLLAASPDK